MKRAALHNLGCKVNAYETEAMQQILEADGYEIVNFSSEADVYVINTCTVTNVADHKSKQMLHRARKKNPNAIIVAAGCYVQAFADQLKEDGSVDVVIGNNQKTQLIEFIEEFKNGGKTEEVIDISKTKEFEPMQISKTAQHTRAFLKIQDGCNQFCSYCIIPYARGHVRCREKEEILKEIQTLADTGYKEVVLTGIHLGSFPDLEDLVLEIAKIEGIHRIRLGSLEPRSITDEFVRKLSNCKEFCPHFHLSLQSGSDTVLKRMNRHYTSDEYYKACELIRSAWTHPAITTDIIVGFPGETEEEFKQTCEFVKKVKFYEVHVFKYSRRKGTKADAMPDQVPEPIKTERSHELIKIVSELSKEFRSYYIGKNVEILTEELVNGLRVGYTPEYVKCAVENKESNELVTVQVVDFLTEELLKGLAE
ncbi:MiaB family protein, possibly involved in tRNA or rRNA modification [Lachnospiraceae bacterium TWA4]|nr:MiaB family protein, possibly involved in tRNA or rRNA modification [Lachnospiraceae bacterium TWA4]